MYVKDASNTYPAFISEYFLSDFDKGIFWPMLLLTYQTLKNMVIFNLKEKKINKIVKIKSSGKINYPTACVKYLGVKTDQQLQG